MLPKCDTARVIMHLDMDAFFASVEQLDNPELRGKPVIVGGSERGVVSAASYEARVYGVRSAMPSAQARRLCPHGVFVPVRGARYAELSRQVFDVVREFSPLVQQTSVDEAYVDASGLERLFGPPREMALDLKARIREATGLTCSIGIAPRKYLAKICSDKDKPDGLYILEEEGIESFLAVLPLREVPGIGPKWQASLAKYGVKHMGDIARFSREFWVERFGDKGGNFLYDRALGIDDSVVTAGGERKSCGSEHTFFENVGDRAELERWLLRQSDKVARRLRRKELYGKTVTVKLRWADFTTLTKARRLAEPTNATRAIHEAAVAIFESIPLRSKVRLIGVTVSNLCPAQRQLSLCMEPDRDLERREKLDQAIDAIKDRFGDEALERGGLLGLGKRKSDS
jgi:DNA polymerase-4